MCSLPVRWFLVLSLSRPRKRERLEQVLLRWSHLLLKQQRLELDLYRPMERHRLSLLQPRLSCTTILLWFGSRRHHLAFVLAKLYAKYRNIVGFVAQFAILWPHQVYQVCSTEGYIHIADRTLNSVDIFYHTDSIHQLFTVQE